MYKTSPKKTHEKSDERELIRSPEEMIVEHLAVEAHQNAAYQLAIVPMAHRLRRVLEAWMCNQEEDRIVTHIVRTCEAALEAHRANNHIKKPTEKEPSPEDNETNGTETTKKKKKKKSEQEQEKEGGRRLER